MTIYIVSTCSAPLEYRQMSKPKLNKDKKWETPPKQLHSVVINGGANVAPGLGIATPKGVATAVKDDDYDWLKEDASFQRHVKRGFMKALEKGAEPKPDAVALGMEKFDGSAPQNVDSGNATAVPQAASADN